MKTEYITIVYDYLLSNNILDEFLYNREYHPNSSSDRNCEYEPINYAFVWSETPEGQSFWFRHNEILKCKLPGVTCDISIDELINHLHTRMSSEQPYEFW